MNKSHGYYKATSKELMNNAPSHPPPAKSKGSCNTPLIKNNKL